MTRREFIKYSTEAGLVIGFAGVCLSLSPDKDYVRPPGAVFESFFYKKCIKCGVCVEVCPTKALDFVGLSSDIKNIGTPKINTSYGGCIAWREECLKCVEACPTDALIMPNNIALIRIGSAFIKKENCINCMMCFNHCPVKGAVLFPNPEGEPYETVNEIPHTLYPPQSLFKPYINNDLCTGCGLCAYICPPRCIDITSEREVRTKL